MVREGDEASWSGKDNGVSSQWADLHLHSFYSDGAFSPEDIIRRASAAGLAVVSLTDHDHVGGLPEAMDAGRRMGVEVIPGLELSASLGEKDVHLLAYLFDPSNQSLLDYLSFFRLERLKRAERMVKKLNQINVPLSLETVLERAGIGSVGRPHIAHALVDDGLTVSYQEAFIKYIGAGGPAFERKFQLTPREAIRLIADAGGLVFLAHPGKYLSEPELIELIKMGLDGIEVTHPSHSDSQRAYYRGIASEYFLLESGGSDFHGGKKGDDATFGTLRVPVRLVDEMKQRLYRS
jgi:predicted metal-dependent phosphoesterase TrpH